MALKLYYHPFSSFCQKVLVALYERDMAFEGELVGTGDPEPKAMLEAIWPIGKFPVLRDEERGVTVPEASLIIQYLDRVRPDPKALVPDDPDAALQAHIWDRFFDLYVAQPMQERVKDCFRPEDGKDPIGVEEAKAQLAKTYRILDAHLADRGGEWVTGEDFTLADCGAGPALFYANIVQPFAGHSQVEAYYGRLLARPSFARAVDEARPYRAIFPLGWPDSYD